MEDKEEFKIFDMYDAAGVVVSEEALKPYLDLRSKLLAKSHGRKKLDKFANAKIPVIERLANRLAVPGHIGKKHKIITCWSSGKYSKNMKTVMEAFEIIEKKTGKNPMQIVVDAIVNSGPRDEVTVIEHAGARYPQSVDVSPMRRINLAIRWIVQGSYQKCFGKKKKMAETLANEIMLASNKNMESYAIQKKNEAEKQADSAR